MKHSLVEQLYLPGTREARRRFFADVGDRLVEDSVSAPEFELFLIYFCALGVNMTEPVESWIKRAGERCVVLGLDALGRTLKIHATHEANHHLMMIDDTRTLTSRWNARHTQQLDADALLASPPTPGIRAYVDLHEDVIIGETPFCQLAIEYEIEGLSVSLGPKLMQKCERMLGKEGAQGLSFLKEHIAIDAGHTLFNAAELERLMAPALERAELLGRTGSRALDAYGMFLTECFSLAKARWAEVSVGEALESASV
jgi:hypothetical protein